MIQEIVTATGFRNAIQCRPARKKKKPARYPVRKPARAGRESLASRSSSATPRGTRAAQARKLSGMGGNESASASPLATARKRCLGPARKLAELHLPAGLGRAVDGVHEAHHGESLLDGARDMRALAHGVDEVRDLGLDRLLVDVARRVDGRGHVDQASVHGAVHAERVPERGAMLAEEIAVGEVLFHEKAPGHFE